MALGVGLMDSPEGTWDGARWSVRCLHCHLHLVGPTHDWWRLLEQGPVVSLLLGRAGVECRSSSMPPISVRALLVLLTVMAISIKAYCHQQIKNPIVKMAWPQTGMFYKPKYGRLITTKSTN